MKFENIKVGDTIFIEERVSTGWNIGEDFFIPKKVERVTKTQFLTEGGLRFSKQDGRKIGGTGYSLKTAYKENEKHKWNSSVVKDQTLERDVFILKRSLMLDIKGKSEKLTSFNNIRDVSLEELQEIDETISNILKKLKYEH